MLTLRTPAKVNIGLWVEKKRPDGYHDLRSLFIPIELFDKLSFTIQTKGIELLCDEPHVPCDSTNLVWKAADLFFTYTGVRSGVIIRLQKEIPVGHGLGGGSSDAAATLVGLNRLFSAKLTIDELFSLALEVGMDCPFFLSPKPSLALGRGEELYGMEIESFDLQLYLPGFGVSTPWAYKNLERLTNGEDACKLLLKALLERRYNELRKWLYNTFEEVVYRRHPELSNIIDWFYKEGAWFAGLSGSGSALYAAFPPDVEIVLPEGTAGCLLRVKTLEKWGVV